MSSNTMDQLTQGTELTIACKLGGTLQQGLNSCMYTVKLVTPNSARMIQGHMRTLNPDGTIQYEFYNDYSSVAEALVGPRMLVEEDDTSGLARERVQDAETPISRLAQSLAEHVNPQISEFVPREIALALSRLVKFTSGVKHPEGIIKQILLSGADESEKVNEIKTDTEKIRSEISRMSVFIRVLLGDLRNKFDRLQSKVNKVDLSIIMQGLRDLVLSSSKLNSVDMVINIEGIETYVQTRMGIGSKPEDTALHASIELRKAMMKSQICTECPHQCPLRPEFILPESTIQSVAKVVK